jgi:hypothetical protein
MKRRGPARSGLFLLTVVSLACAKPGDVTQAWLGHGAGELANVWGQPSEEVTGADASRTMTYVSYWSNGLGSTHTCRKVFTTDGAGIIRAASMSGC